MNANWVWQLDKLRHWTTACHGPHEILAGAFKPLLANKNQGAVMQLLTGTSHSNRRISAAVIGLAVLGLLPGVAAALPESAVAESEGAVQILRDVGTGKALEEYWSAEAVEYRATAEAVLSSVGASYISRGAISSAVLSDFLVLFGGGGGAPQDLVKLRPESASIQQKTVVK